MPLPVVKTPTYNTMLPLRKEKVAFRPFLVKEEKILLIAMQSEDKEQIADGINEIVSNCTFGKIDPRKEKYDLGDIEYLFVQMRAKSKGEVSEFKMACKGEIVTKTKANKAKKIVASETRTPCENILDVSVDMTEIKIDAGTISNTFEIPNGPTIVFRHPDFKETMGISEIKDVDGVMDLFKKFTEQVYDEAEVYKFKDYSDAEVLEFLESLDSSVFQHFQEFLADIPRIYYDIESTCPACKTDNKYHLSGIESFFG